MGLTLCTMESRLDREERGTLERGGMRMYHREVWEIVVLMCGESEAL